MKRVSHERLIRNVALGAMLAQVTVLIGALRILDSGQVPPGIVTYPLLCAFFVCPVVACGILVVALLLRLQGGLSLRHREVSAGIIFAVINLAITAGLALLAYLIREALSGGVTF
jgi:hypothetical protein